VVRAFGPVRVDRLRYQYDFFAVDDFKVSPSLTINLGLRYEYHPAWTEEHGMGAMFDIASGKIVVQDGMGRSTSLAASSRAPTWTWWKRKRSV